MKKSRGQTQTPGGNRLRTLRDDCRRTQLDVELDASLGIGYLQRVESGKVRYPERDTLERILAALGAHYTERAEILELFGYLVDTPLPDEREIERAVEICRAELSEAVFPAYLLDCANHLLAWNACFARLFQVERFDGRLSMVRLMFDPSYGITGRIANPDEFFPAQIRALRYQMRLFRGESWYAPLIDDLYRCCPLFRLYWEQAGESPSLAARPLIPFVITLPDGESGRDGLRFRLTSEPFAQDRRFRMIYYLPADPVTTQQCIAWMI